MRYLRITTTFNGLIIEGIHIFSGLYGKITQYLGVSPLEYQGDIKTNQYMGADLIALGLGTITIPTGESRTCVVGACWYVHIKPTNELQTFNLKVRQSSMSLEEYQRLIAQYTKPTPEAPTPSIPEAQIPTYPTDIYRTEQAPLPTEQVLTEEAKPSGCFIATASYGSPTQARVCELRALKDRLVMRSLWAELTYRLYYVFSPCIAMKIRSMHKTKAIVRNTIEFMWRVFRWLRREENP